MWIRNIAADYNTTTELLHTFEDEKYVFDNEYDFLRAIFEEDNKNYHAWSHLVWMVERYQLWHDSRNQTFISDHLDSDVQNNSVWSFKYFIFVKTNQLTAERVE